MVRTLPRSRASAVPIAGIIITAAVDADHKADLVIALRMDGALVGFDESLFIDERSNP
jgi:hypothetical protein